MVTPLGPSRLAPARIAPHQLAGSQPVAVTQMDSMQAATCRQASQGAPAGLSVMSRQQGGGLMSGPGMSTLSPPGPATVVAAAPHGGLNQPNAALMADPLLR